MLSKKTNTGVLLLLSLLVILLCIEFPARATSVSVGDVLITDTANNISNSSGTITSKVESTSNGAEVTNTITLKNNSTNAATLSFDYEYTRRNRSIASFAISGSGGFSTESAKTGTHSVDLAAGQSITVTIKAKRDGYTSYKNEWSQIVISNITLTIAQGGQQVAVFYDKSGGSVTVNGTAITSGDSSEATGEGAALVATPASGYKFYGWLDSSNKLISSSAQETVIPKSDITIRAVFYKPNVSDAWFLAGDGCLYDDLTVAVTKGATVVPVFDGVLPAGDYTIPEGVTLLIPFDDANTCYTTSPGKTDTRTPPSLYRTLTMASGANITVANGGAISVSAQQYATSTQVTAVVNGAYGQIKMQGNSNITVQSGGKLYAWGFISRAAEGSEGTVTIENGGSVYEMFQVTGYRGGDATSSMSGNGNKVFPLNQYYVQNVEVPMTLMAGAIEYCEFTVSVTLAGVQSTTFPFIGQSDGMFRLTSGSITKDYVEGSDRLRVTMADDSKLAMSSITINIKVALIGSVTMNSAEYVMPIQNNVDVMIGTGCTVKIDQDMALLPGATLSIGSGSTVNMGSHALYVYDLEGWGNYAYAGQTHYCIPYVAAGTVSKTYRTLTDAKVNVDGTFTGIMYSVGGEANIHGTGTLNLTAGSTTTTCQATQSGTDITYVTDIPVTPAKLLNADDSYVSTSSGTYTYCSECGAWAYDGYSHLTNVELGNSLNMYFAFWSTANDSLNTQEASWAGYYVEISCNGGAPVKLYFEQGKWMVGDVNDDKAYDRVVSFTGLTASQMSDLVTVKLYSSNGVLVDTWCNSIRSYAIGMLERDKLAADADPDSLEAKRCKLLVDMLNYGAACQKYFAEKNGIEVAGDKLANYGLDAYQSCATESVDVNTNCTTDLSGYYIGANLITDSNSHFVVGFKNADWRSVSFTFTNHWHNQEEGYEPPTFTISNNDDTDYCYIPKLVMADARAVITIVVTYRDGEIEKTETFYDSMVSYCARMIENGEVFTEFMKFSDAAEVYLESKATS